MIMKNTLFAILVAALLQGCGGGMDTPSNAPAAQSANVESFRVSVRDTWAPMDGFGANHIDRIYDSVAATVSGFAPGSNEYREMLTDAGLPLLVKSANGDIAIAVVQLRADGMHIDVKGQ